MRSLRFAALLLVSIFLLPGLVFAQPADGKSDLATNAALQYWQAFAQMPTLDEDQQKLLEQWNSIPLDDKAQKLIASSQSSLMYLHRGANLSQCDWGLDYNDGISMLLPHLGKARDLARLAALHARSEFQQKHWKEGQDDAAAIMTLARHVGRDPIMISILVRYAIEGATMDLLAPYVPDLKTPYSKTVEMYGSLPPGATLQESVFIEKKFMAEWMIRKLKEEEKRQKGAGLELWRKILDGPEIPDSLKQIQSFEEAVKQTEELLPVYDVIAKFVVLPPGEFEAQYEPFFEKTKAAHPLAAALLPATNRIVAAERRNKARMEMLLAAFAVAEGGPDKLKEIKDPFGDGPFEYRALDKGFELKSKVLYDGQPVTLTIGQKKD